MRHSHRPASDWDHAYALCLANALLFVTLSAISMVVGVGSVEVNATIPAIFAIGSVASGLLLIRAGAGPVPVAMFVFGAGLIFGFGTTYAVVFPSQDWIGLKLFSRDVQSRLLDDINLMNSVSVLCVLLVAKPMSRMPSSPEVNRGGVERVVAWLSGYISILCVLSVAIVAVMLATYPIAENLVLRSAIGTLSRVPLLVVALGAARWRFLSLGVKVMVLFIFVSMVAMGILSASKGNTLLPLGAVIAGLWINRGSRRLSVVAMALTALAYFTAVAPLSQAVRNSPHYDGGRAGLSQSVQNIVFATGAIRDDENTSTRKFLQRFSAAPYQGYLIDQFNAGAPGDSLRDLWAAIVPRALWPDKPNITRFGGQFYRSLNRTSTGASQLAPTYTAEAYWNYGWLGVIAFSGLIGLEVGWFTRRWLAVETGKSVKPGIIVFAIPISMTFLFLESWIASTFVGGVATMIILVLAIDWVAPQLDGWLARQSRPARAGGRFAGRSVAVGPEAPRDR